MGRGKKMRPGKHLMREAKTGLKARIARMFHGAPKPSPKPVRTNLIKSAIRTMGPTGLVIGGALATAAAFAGVKAIYERMTRDRDFQRALAESPTARKNKIRAYKHFMTLRRVNPELSKDPLVAAGYMNKGMAFEQEGIDPSIALALKSPGRVERLYDPMAQAKIHQKFMLGED